MQYKVYHCINNKLTINNSQIRGTNKDYYIKWDKGIKDKGIHKRDEFIISNKRKGCFQMDKQIHIITYMQLQDRIQNENEKYPI